MTRPSVQTSVPWSIALLVFLFAFDGDSIQTPFFAISASNLALGLAVLLTVLPALRSRRGLIPPPPYRWFLLLVLWLIVAEFVSALLSPEGGLARFRPLVTWTGFLLVIWVIGMRPAQDDDTPTLIGLGIAGAMSLIGILTFAVLVGLVGMPETGNSARSRVVCDVPFPPRGLGTSMTFGYFGLLSSLALPSLVQTVRGRRLVPLNRATAASLATVIVVVMLITAARSVWLTGLALIVALAVLVWIAERRLTLGPVVLLILAFVGMNLLLGCSVLSRLPSFDELTALPPAVGAPSPTGTSGLLGPSAPPSASPTPGPLVSMDYYTVQSRLAMYRAALEMFRVSPIFGLGSTRADGLVLPLTGYEGPIHNKFLGVLAGLGLFGAIPFLGLWAFAGWHAMRVIRLGQGPWSPRAVALVAALVGMAVQLQFFAGESLKPLAVVIGLIANGAVFLEGKSKSDP